MVWKHCRKTLIILAGLIVTATGLILMPVPGPGGTPVFLAGLAILSTECGWAKELLARFKRTYTGMDKNKRRALTYSLLVFYLASGVVAWNWASAR